MPIEVTDSTHINVPNLQNATGINSNNLSDFNPDGSGTTSMSDFLIDAVGKWDSANAQWLANLYRTSADGLYEIGDTIKIAFQIEHADIPNESHGSQFWFDQVFTSNYISTIDNLSFQSASTGTEAYVSTERTEIILTFEVTGTNSVLVGVTVDEALNQHAINHNTELLYDSTNDGNVTIRDDTPQMESLRVYGQSDGSGGTDIDFTVELYDPADKINDYLEWDVGLAGVDEGRNVDGQTQATWTKNYPESADGADETITVTLRDGSGGTIQHEEGAFSFTIGDGERLYKEFDNK